MKYLRLAWLCLVCVPPTNVCAQVVNGIDILSSVYSVNATWSYTWTEEANLNTIPYTPGSVYSSGSGNYGGTNSDGSPLSVELTGTFTNPPVGAIGRLLGGSTQIGIGNGFNFFSDTSAPDWDV